jgi:hypothetical protein
MLLLSYENVPWLTVPSSGPEVAVTVKSYLTGVAFAAVADKTPNTAIAARAKDVLMTFMPRLLVVEEQKRQQFPGHEIYR